MDAATKNSFYASSVWGFSKTGFSMHVIGKPDISLINVGALRNLTKDIVLIDLTTFKSAISTEIHALNHAAIPTLNLSMFHAKAPMFKNRWTSIENSTVNMKSPDSGSGGEGSSGNEPDTSHGSRK